MSDQEQRIPFSQQGANMRQPLRDTLSEVSFGAPNYGSEPPKPNIDLPNPESVQPKDLLEVKLDSGWTDIVIKTEAQPGRYDVEPKIMSGEVSISDDYAMLVHVSPKESFFAHGIGLLVNHKFFGGLELMKRKTPPGPTQQGANIQAAENYLFKNIHTFLGWDLISSSHDRRESYFITPQGKKMKAYFYSGGLLRLEYIDPIQTQNTTDVEEVIQLLEGSLSKLGSLAIELLSPDKNNLPSKQTISLHIPTLTESSNFTSPSRDENQRNTPMMSGFDPENNKSYVEGLSLEDLGGNFEVRDEIEGLIEILSHADHFRKYDAQPPRGILLWGPPGTGKTLAAKIIASQLGINFYEFSSADLMNVFVGESPKIVQSIFRDTKKPCIIFLDEIDAILTSRKDSLGGKVDTEVRQEFLRGLDGLASVPGVTLIGATNNREGIDSAVLRPGRIDRQIYVGLPNEEARSQILGIHLQKALATGRQNEVNIFSRDIEEHLQTLSQAMDGFSGADIAEVVRRSVLFVARRTLKDPVYVIDVAQMQHIVEQIRTEKAEQKHRQVGFTSNNY